MASDVEICNLALSHLGDEATVASIDPPEGSAQAEHCARFYPLARDTLLELHAWNFTTTRVSLALLADATASPWQYAYQLPSDVVNILMVIAPDATSDYSAALGNGAAVTYAPQQFEVEVDQLGRNVVLTNQANAVLRYTKTVTDTAQFSPLFTTTLALLLASYLAGPVLKGQTGRQMSAQLMKEAMASFGQAAKSDANDRKINPAQNTDWMGARV